MTAKIILEDYEIEDLMNLEIGEIIETCDVNGIDCYIERVNSDYYGSIKIYDKYYIVNYFAPSKSYIKYKNEIFNN